MAPVDRWTADRLATEVDRLGVRGLPYGELHAELAARIRRLIPVDAMCWHGLDPDTKLVTTANPVELLRGGFLTPETEAKAASSVVTSEYLREDVNTFAALVARRTPVGILSETTRGRPQRSARYVEYLEPIGTPFEMRVAMVTRGRAPGVRRPAPNPRHRRLHSGRGTDHGEVVAADRGGPSWVLPGGCRMQT